MKKLTSVFLVLMLVLALLPVGVLAQDGEAGTVAEESDTTLTTPVDTTEVKTEGEGELEETPKTEDEPKVEENKVEENKVEEEPKTEDENKVEDELKTEEVQLEGNGTEGEGNGENNSGATPTETKVAKNGNNEYTTLAEAIEKASAGDTITLLADVTENVVVNKNLTIDLGGKKITNVNDHTITVNCGVTLTITGTGTVDNVTHKRGAIFNKGNVILNGGTYTRSQENGGNNSWYTIKNVGTMTISGAVSVSNASGFSSMITNGYYSDSDKAACGGIDAPKLTITGGAFSGGINTIKNDDYGVLEISGGTFSNTTQACVQNHNVATISGGTFSPQNVNAVINCGTNCTQEEAPVKHELTITNGTFNGGISRTVGTITVTGGTFSSDPSDYVDDDYVATEGSGTWTVARKADVATIGEDGYTSLQKAINAASGTTAVEITLEADVTEDVTIDSGKNIKLNLNNHKITNKSSHTITVASGAELEITGTGTVDNVTHAKGAIVNSGTVVLSGGTYTRSKEDDQNNKGSAGKNSWYTILNDNGGNMTIKAGVNVTNVGHFSSMIRNGGESISTLTIEGGTFSGGINTVKNDDYGVLNISGGSFSNTTQYVIMNWHDATISGGSFAANPEASAVLFSAKFYTQDDTTKTKGDLKISGGTFTAGESQALVTTAYTKEGSDTPLTGSVTITGGTFSADPNAYVTADDKAAVKSGNVWVVKTDNTTETDEKTGTTTTTNVTKTDGKTTVTETTQTKDATSGKITSTTVIKTEITDDATTVTKIANITENNVATTTTVADNKATVKAEMQPGGAGSTVNTGVRTLKLDATTAAEQGSAKKTEVTIASDATKLLKQDAAADNDMMVEIKTDVATVTIDSTAIQTMTATGSGTTSATLKLVVEETNAPSAVQDAKAAYALDAYLNDVPVFKAEGASTNGTVVISVPYEKTANTTLEVYYVSADGKTQEKMVAEYEDGVLTWETNHFSTFVVVEKANAAKDDAAKPADAKKPPRTGDESNLTLWLALALLATCATVTTTVVAKKKSYNR